MDAPSSESALKCSSSRNRRESEIGFLHFRDEDKRVKCAQLKEAICMDESLVPLKSIQMLMWKCISFLLVLLGAKVYIRDMAAAIAMAIRFA